MRAMKRGSRMNIENSPVGSSKSNGTIERAIQSVQGMIRTVLGEIEEKWCVKMDVTRRILCGRGLPSEADSCERSVRTFIPTIPDWFTSVLDPTSELGLSVAYLSPDRSSHRSPRDLSDPFVRDRHTFHQAFPDIVRHLGAHRKPSSISLPLYSAIT